MYDRRSAFGVPTTLTYSMVYVDKLLRRPACMSKQFAVTSQSFGQIRLIKHKYKFEKLFLSYNNAIVCYFHLNKNPDTMNQIHTTQYNFYGSISMDQSQSTFL